MTNQSINSAVRTELLKGVAKQQGVEELQKQLDEKRAGMYSHGIAAARLAIEMSNGNREEAHKAVVETFDTLASDFKANRREIATRHNCEQAKDTNGKPQFDDDENPVYKVPSSLSTMRYVVNQAFELGISFDIKMLDPDGNPKLDDDGNPMTRAAPFSAVRDAAKAARDAKKEAAAKAARTPDDDARDSLREIVEALLARIDTLEGDALKAAAKILQTAGESLDKLAA